jgi:hypothetical protein
MPRCRLGVLGEIEAIKREEALPLPASLTTIPVVLLHAR